MASIDSRLYKILQIGGGDVTAVPGSPGGSYVGDYYESEMAALTAGDERASGNESEDANIKSLASEKAADAKNKWDTFRDTYTGVASFIHPYALFHLTGATGTKDISGGNYMFDVAGRRRWYEIDGDLEGGYATAPTTTSIINWGRQDPKGKFPYAFTDFVFCKYWNRIPNNRMITLRRYAMPVPDSAEPADYEKGGKQGNDPFAPVATAVTYFGEGTGNSLSDIMKFTVGYDWEEIQGDVWITTSQQNESGQIMGPGAGWLGSGLSQIVKTLSILDDLQGNREIQVKHAAGIGPDPYSNGPYENRIIGPVNVIDKVYKRKRSLKFSQEGLSIVFEYNARPISGVNNKAIMIDLMSNMLIMTSASGTFFGGAHRYRTEHPAVYPMRDTLSLSKFYKGKIFGKDGAPSVLMHNAFNGENINFMMNFAKNLFDDIKTIAGNFLDAIVGKSTSGNATSGTNGALSKAADTAGRVISAHLLKGSTIPYIHNARALLTGEPIGDWHLTIGNPLNPIAMIGNLIVDSCDIELGNELGPDDFPLSFKATVNLKHGMGRDRDAVMSMFNRGYGRTYSLPDDFITSADKGTKVDKYTADVGQFGKLKHYGAWQTSGSDYISSMSHVKLSNKGSAYDGGLRQYNVDIMNLNPSDSKSLFPLYKATPWHTRWTL